jgi:hypothetical protein
LLATVGPARASSAAAHGEARSRQTASRMVPAAQQRRGGFGRATVWLSGRWRRELTGDPRKRSRSTCVVVKAFAGSEPPLANPTTTRKPRAAATAETARTRTVAVMAQLPPDPTRKTRPHADDRKGAPTFATRTASRRRERNQRSVRSDASNRKSRRRRIARSPLRLSNNFRFVKSKEATSSDSGDSKSFPSAEPAQIFHGEQVVLSDVFCGLGYLAFGSPASFWSLQTGLLGLDRG